MTDATAPELYPQYCFQLSPTINRWCHLRIADITALTSHPGFEGQDVYFHLNHPIKWVRASGVVIAVDEWEERSIYTLDDGSGATIQCVVNVAPRGLPGDTTTTTTSNQYQYTRPLPVIDAPIDVGHVLDIRGSVGTFRDTKNIRAEKIAHLGSTEQEVLFWEKVVLLRRDVLSQPWVLDQRTVRRCKREEEGRRVTGLERKRETGLERRGQTGLERGKETGLGQRRVTGLEKRSASGPDRKETCLEKKRVTGLEKRVATKPITRVIPVTGKYDALGL
ncbi:hypothetical protein BT67DRAFT_378601 [Trichocladium antarcticum]|uniref:CST complex subunit Stn1 N-terminal domain-containing protein n=1 Tax=Trichocladium antarcticum TaxID=1450529 RepID=A0AAN6ZES6_9PEZI|nr:hypothetical protein BT67DRAFT_378601 [Trichocladium antarcticum]